MTDNVVVGSSIVALGWSLVPILYKEILKNMPAKTLFLLYYITASIILSVYVFFNWNNLDFDISNIHIKQVILLFCAVMAGSIVANYVYYALLKKNQVYLVTILTSISPLLTILIAYFFLGEIISLRQWIGIILAIIGTTLAVA